MDLTKIHVHLSVHLHTNFNCLERTCHVRNLISFVVIIGALCSFVKPSKAICAYDNVKAYYLELVKDAKEICILDNKANVCTSLETAEMIPPPALKAVPESLDEARRKDVMCENNEKMSLWYQTRANLIRADLSVRSLNKLIDEKNAELKKDKDVVAFTAKDIKSNPDLLEIKLRDHVLDTIIAEIKKHLEGIPLNDADIHVLALQVCKKNIRPVTRSIVKFLFEKSDRQLSKMCGILAGK